LKEKPVIQDFFNTVRVPVRRYEKNEPVHAYANGEFTPNPLLLLLPYVEIESSPLGYIVTSEHLFFGFVRIDGMEGFYAVGPTTTFRPTTALVRALLKEMGQHAHHEAMLLEYLQKIPPYTVGQSRHMLSILDFLVNGEYGKRMLTIAKNSRRNYDYLSFDMTQPIDVETVEKKLKKEKDIAAVIFAHCETTTGVLNPLEEIAELAKSYGKKVLVDAMSSFAAYEIDMVRLDIDALAASSNKCLEGLPGLSFVVTKKKLLEKSEGRSRSHSLDLFDQYQGLYAGGGKFRFTSPTNVLLALRQAINEYKKEGGLQARKARYIENHKILTGGFEKLGIKSIVAPEHQSYIITTFELGGFNFSELYAALKSKGFIIYPGKMTDTPTFRIGNIGDIYPSDMIRLVEAVKEISGK